MYPYLCYFFIYAVLGWCLEVTYAAVCEGTFVNRGFLNGPLCPVYGVGAVIVIFCLTPLRENTIVLFLCAVALASLLEWATGFVLETLFHQKWWDYSNEPFNISGYICLKFSLLWGVACLVVMEIIHPAVAAFVRWIPPTATNILLGTLGIVMLLDILATVQSVLNLNRRLKQIDALGGKIKHISDGVGVNLSGEVLKVAQKTETWKQTYKESLDAAAAMRAQLRTKQDALTQKLHYTQVRLIKAFPDLKSNRYKDALEKIKRTVHKK